MTPKDLWPQYQHYARDLTEHGRKMGFAAGGICWLLRTETFVFPQLIYLSLGALALYFVFDILQTLIGAITLRIFIESKEAQSWRAKGHLDDDFQKPRWVDAFPFALWYMKAVLLVVSFGFIGAELYKRLHHP